MRWRDVGPYNIRSEEVANVYAEIVVFPVTPQFKLNVWRTWAVPDREDQSRVSNSDHATLDDAKAAALPLMRAAVIAARDEAHNAVLDASRWLRANGGEP